MPETKRKYLFLTDAQRGEIARFMIEKNYKNLENFYDSLNARKASFPKKFQNFTQCAEVRIQ